MTIATIEAKARRILQDTEVPYRWESSEIRDSIQEGVYALNAIRPETRYVNGELKDAVNLPDGNDMEMDIHNHYEEALVYYVVHKCYLNDSTDTMNAQLAEMYLSKFNTKAQL